MKVFNLTDVPTPALTQHKLVGHTIAVGPHLLAAGQSCDIDPVRLQHIRAGLQELITIGALAVGDQPPAGYVVAKTRTKSLAVPPPAPETPPAAVKPPPASKVPSSKKSRS